MLLIGSLYASESVHAATGAGRWGQYIFLPFLFELEQRKLWLSIPFFPLDSSHDYANFKIYLVVLVAIYIFVIVYSATWSIAFQIYSSEIQPPKTRAAASSLAQSANWVCDQQPKSKGTVPRKHSI